MTTMAQQQHSQSQSGSQFMTTYQVHHPPQIRPVIERGASWSYNETRILLSLWGQDMVQRQLTNSKRTRHVWEKIAERIREHGFERTADQVRTRVFNMIAEYRRILKNPTPERKKKCIFFDALHKIYQAKDSNAIKLALNNYEEEYNIEPLDFNTDDMEDGNEENGDASGSDNEDKSEIFAYSLSPSQLNHTNITNGGGNNTDGHSNGEDDDDMLDSALNINDDMPLAPPPAKRTRLDRMMDRDRDHNMNNSSSGHHQSVLNSSYLDHSSQSSGLLIDRMFAHLSKETEVMREWVNLERERLTQEITRRKEESDRDERREKSFLSVLMKMQEQMFSFLAKQHQQQLIHVETQELSPQLSPPPLSQSDDQLSNNNDNDIENSNEKD